jgi:hypothetical protein
MTRTYSMRRLLEHGALSFSELLAITGWPRGAVKAALARLDEAGLLRAEQAGPHRNVYGLV